MVTCLRLAAIRLSGELFFQITSLGVTTRWREPLSFPLPGSFASTEVFFNLGESSIVMESKEAEVQKAAAAGCYRKTVGEEATFMESSKDLLRQFKDKPAREHWVCLKNKVRAAGEYASLRTRQGISMFGEPKLHSYIKDGAEDEPKKMASTTEI